MYIVYAPKRRLERARQEPNNSPSDATQIGDPAIMRVNCNFEPSVAIPRATDERPRAAIDAPNMPETAVSQEALAIPARSGVAIVEAGSDIQVNRSGLRGSGRSRRRRKAQSQTKASKQKTVHRGSPYQASPRHEVVTGRLVKQP